MTSKDLLYALDGVGDDLLTALDEAETRTRPGHAAGGPAHPGERGPLLSEKRRGRPGQRRAASERPGADEPDHPAPVAAGHAAIL